MHGGIPAALLSVMMTAVFALGAGGVWLIRKGERQKGILMVVAALVLLGNVLIWTIPMGSD